MDTAGKNADDPVQRVIKHDVQRLDKSDHGGTGRVDHTYTIRHNYSDLLLNVAAQIFPGVTTAWAGAPEMVARHTVEIAEMLIAEVEAAANKKYSIPKSAAEVSQQHNLEAPSKQSQQEPVAQETEL